MDNALERQKRRALIGLQDARANFLNISKADLTYQKIVAWLQQWQPAFHRVQGVVTVGLGIYGHISSYMAGYEAVTDVDDLSDVRTRIIEFLDTIINRVDSSSTVKPILEEYIAQVADNKLSTLLREFNIIKDIAPNHAAMGFRTIVSLLVQEKAKREQPDSSLAIQQDLACAKVIQAASAARIFTSAEQKLLDKFLMNGKKDIFDIVVHKPGDTNIVSKEDLNAAVDILIRLLPSII